MKSTILISAHVIQEDGTVFQKIWPVTQKDLIDIYNVLGEGYILSVDTDLELAKVCGEL